MPIIDPYRQTFSKDGWICSVCGQWVQDGVLHYCYPQHSGIPAESTERIRLLDETMHKVIAQEEEIKEIYEMIAKLEDSVKKIMVALIGEGISYKGE